MKKIIISVFMISLLNACTNSQVSRRNLTATSPAVATATSAVNFTIATLTATGTSSTVFNLSFATNVTQRISTYCNTSQTLPCRCKFTWVEKNEASGTTYEINREAYTTPSLVQSSLVSCPAPTVYDNANQEVPVGTIVSISVEPVSSAISFSVTPKTYKKQITGTVEGSFQDEEGRSFDDIYRYTCFDQEGSAGKVVNKLRASPINNIYPLYANRLCHPDDGDDVDDEQCINLKPTGKSVDAFYYNLYIKGGAVGTINPGNKRFTCPKVAENIGRINTVANVPGYYPLDKTFSLALHSSGKFNVAVDSVVRTGNPSDPNASTHSSCTGTNTSSATESDLQTGCLGFAARPEADGTCKAIRMKDGNLKNMYRLRRFIALYPTHFNSKGAPAAQKTSRDITYVLDRPVYTNPFDPSEYATMLGPKPCNFAYFDKMKVGNYDARYYTVNATPTIIVDSLDPVAMLTYCTPIASCTVIPSVNRYISTNSVMLNGKNPNGFKFPNYDYYSNVFNDPLTETLPSCSVNMQLYNEVSGIASLATIHSSNPVASLKDIWIRAQDSWSPHYVEDTDFKACAPVPNTIVDPPLHFAENNSTTPSSPGMFKNQGYCAMVYPTQNPYVNFKEVEPTPATGLIKTYTSAKELNTISGIQCTPTTYADMTAKGLYNGAFSYPAVAATLKHTVDTDTCDRTVYYENPNKTKVTMPLQAAPADVESMLNSDESYNCTLTSNPSNTSDARIGKETPLSCCKMFIHMRKDSLAYSNAHLEPPPLTTIPSYCSTTRDY